MTGRLEFAADEQLPAAPAGDEVEPDDALDVEPLDGDPLDVEPLEVPHDVVGTRDADPAVLASTGSALPVPIMEVLPVDFALPALIRFVPDVRLKARVEDSAAKALAIPVTGAEGLQAADAALAVLREDMKDAEGHFEEPTATANALHKRLTAMRAEFVINGKTACDTVGRRIWHEQQRLDQIEKEARRKEQDEANRKARELAQAEAEAASRNKAPAPVVEEMRARAANVTAAPVARTAAAPPKLANTTTVTTWKARIKDTPADDEPNPDIEVLSPAQRLQFFESLRAILDGRAPIRIVTYDWGYLNKRAAADKGTFAIPGLEAFADGGTRAKGRRAKP